ncbi:MAG: hypothetical protein AB1555_05725 [Nitrospirota bacterium]
MSASSESEEAEERSSDDIRCECGRLLARWCATGIEIKCKRCRRVRTIPLTSIRGKPPRLDLD